MRAAWRRIVAIRSAVTVTRSEPLVTRVFSPEVDGDDLRVLAGDDDPAVRRAVAMSPRTPPEVLRALAGESDPPAVLDGTQADGASPGRSPMRAVVAKNPSAPADLFVDLVADPDPRVREGAARNPSTPPELLAVLVGDPSEPVRTAVAHNWSAPPDLLAQLGTTTRRGSVLSVVLAHNPNCPEDVRARLAGLVKDHTQLTWRTAPWLVGKSLAGIVVAGYLARREARRHPDDPGIAVVGLRSWAFKSSKP